MKATELRQKSLADLKKELTNSLKEQFKLKMAHATGNLTNFNALKKNRRTIARIHSLITEKSEA